MVSEITSLLQHGWENLWKNRILWLFSSLVLIEPLIRLIVPNQKNVDLAPSVFNFVISLASIYFVILSDAGVSFVAYCIAIGNPVELKTAFQASKKLRWRIVALSFLLLVFAVPFVCTIAFSFRQLLQIVDIHHNIFFTSFPLYIFVAMWYFPITETITSDSKIGESLKTAWTVFRHNFVNLAIIGLLLISILRVIDISSSMAIMLVQNNLDISALNNLDFISPQSSFSDNNFYKLTTAITQTIWQTYSASIFTFAYLKYKDTKIKKSPMV